MALVNGPLFSLEASGQLGKALVYSKWKGRSYVREYVIPANPRTLDQLIQRGNLSALAKWWSGLGTVPANWESWDDLASTLSVSAFNAFMKTGLLQLQDGQYPYGNDAGTGAAPDGIVDALAATLLGPGRVQLTADTSTAGPAITDLTIFTIGTDGGANTTTNSTSRTIAGKTQNAGAAVIVEVDNIPPGTYFFAADVVGSDGEGQGLVSTPSALVVT